MKKRFLTLVLMALLLPWTAKSQTTLTVADGSTTNSYVPVYGLWADDYTRSQMIYPSTMLEELTGGTITSLTFFDTTGTQDWGAATFDVKLGEVTETSLSSYLTYTSTTVYSGSLTISNHQMTITFTTPYTYMGGNLMIEFYQLVEGTYHSVYFYGVSATGASASGYNSTSAASASFSQRNFLPKVEFTYTPGSGDFCYSVRNLNLSDITADGCTLTWIDTLNSGASYSIYNMADTSIIGTTTSTTYTVTGLNSNTAYQLGVVADCGSGTVSSYKTVSFRTACSGYTNVPYAEDFENYSTGATPNCWMQVATGTNNSVTFPSVYNYASNTHNGDGYFEFESSSSSADTEIVALPEMANISDLRLAMWVSSTSSYPCSLEVGVLEADGSFTRVDSLALITFSGTSGWKNNYHEYITYFNNYGGTGDRIALRAIRTGSGQYTLFVDDLTVTMAGAPEILSMPARLSTDINTDLVISAVVGGELSSATYSWTSTMADAGNATMVPADTALTINYTAAGTDTVTLIVSNSLGEDTAYTIVNARDLSPITTLPYSTGFEENEDVNWIFINDTNAWVIDTAANNTPEGSKSMYISNDNGATNDYVKNIACNSYAIRYFQFNETGEYALSFDWRCMGEVSGAYIYDYLTAYLAPASADLFSGTISRTDWEDLTGKLAGQNSWQNAGTTFTITTPGTYPIVFYWRNDFSSGSAPAAAVDNIVVNSLSCSSVASITLDSINSNEMTFHWSPVGTESAWHVVVGNLIDVDVYDTTYTATELSANTQYDIAVYAVCGADDTSFATTASYRTTCGAEVFPWNENFDATVSSNPCWGGANTLASTILAGDTLNMGGITGWYYQSSMSNGVEAGHYLVNIYGSNCKYWMVTPEIDLTEAIAPMLSFDAAFTTYSGASAATGFESNNTQAFMVIISTDGGLTWLDTNATKWQNAGGQHTLTEIASTSYIQQFVDLQQYAGQTIRIAFYAQSTTSGGDNNLHIDNIAVTETTTCRRPSAVSAVATSDSDVMVDITGIDEASYRIYWTDGSTTDSTDVTNSNYTITGLTPSTTYTISVATICDEGTLTTSVSTTVRTQCAGGGCDVVIDMEDSWGDGWNGNTILGYVGNEQVFSATIISGSTGTYTYSMCSSDTLVLIWDEGNYSSETSFTISNGDFSLTAAGDDYNDGDTIGVVEGCPSCLQPVNLVIDSTSADQIDFHWTAVGGESSWEVTLNGGTPVVVSTTSYSATGLTHSTTYNIAIRALCSESDISGALTGTVMTLIVPTELPYSTGFETDDDMAWLSANNDNGWYIGTATACTGTGSMYISDDNGVSNDYTNSTSSSYAYKLFHFATPGTYVVNFNWKGHGESSYDYLRVFAAPATTSFTAGSTNGISTTGTPANWEALDGGSKLNLQDNWNNQVGTITITNDTTLFVVFYWKNDSGVQNQPPAAIDNIQVAELSCMWPTNISFSDVTDNSATISWTAGGSENQWSVSIDGGTPVVVNDSSYTVSGLTPSTTHTVSIRALCSATDSSFASSSSFRTACVASTLPYSEDFEAMATDETPECWDNLNGNTKVSTSYTHNGTHSLKFSGSTANMVAMPDFTQNISDLTINFWTRPESKSAYCGSFSVGYLTDLTDTSTFVAVETYSYSDTAFGTNSATYAEKSVTFVGAPAGARIAFRHNAGSTAWYWFVDDITVSTDQPVTYYTVNATTADATMGSASVTPSGNVAEGTTVTFTATAAEGFVFAAWINGELTVSTANPYSTTVNSDLTLTAVFESEIPCTAPTNLTATNVTRTSAVLGWTAEESQQAWQIHIRGTNYNDTIDVNTNPYTVTGLVYGVTYTFEVRALCGTGRYGEWSASQSFTTTSCEGVTGVTVSNVTSNSAVISWTAPQGATNFEIEYGQSGFTQNSGTRVSVENATSYTLTGLTANMPYDVYVRTVCGEGTTSSWSSVAQFTTTNGEGIDDVNSAAINIYPNPASVTVTFSGIEGETSVIIVDMNGREVYRTNTNHDLTVNVGNFSKGAYFVRMTSERTTAIRKLIVQ